MIERALRFTAIALSLIVAAGFVLFAIDDFDRASDSSRNRVLGDPSALAFAATDGGPNGMITVVAEEGFEPPTRGL